MRRPLALLVAVAALLVAAASASANQAVKLVESGGASFPNRAYILTLATRAPLNAGNVEVRENGGPVTDLTVTPASAGARGDFGVVLAIDASNSMHGDAIKGAMAAARTFAARRAPNEQLAIVSFNSTANTVLPFTTDATAIRSALSNSPQLAYGTHIYDGVKRALDMISTSRIASASIVVLSDGADTGSTTSAIGAAHAAQNAHVRVFTVGLRSKAFTPTALQQLAARAGGDYSEASSPDQLAAIFDQLGARLSNEYLIRYRSLAAPNARVRVAVRVRGVSGTMQSGYVTPALPKVYTPPFQPSLAYRFWRSPVSMLFFSLMVAGLLGLGIALAVRPRPRTARRRLSEFVNVAEPDSGRRSTTSLTDSVLTSAERSLERTRWWAQFKEELEIAEIRMPAVQIVVLTVIGTIAFAWFVAIVTGSALFSLFAFGIPFLVRAYVKQMLARKRKAFGEQLPENLQMLSSALRAGHSFVGGLSVVVEDAEEPSRREFRRVVADEQLGVPLEDALETVVRRMASEDLEQVALVAALHRETGGNTAEVLDRVNEVVRGRIELRQRVKTLTAQGRLSRWIVTALPVSLMLVLSALNPGYMSPLFTHTIGRVLLVLAGIMVVAGSLAIKKIVEIEDI
jgi:tight adherence protein B